jgi:sugar diacid utilization regulator
VLTAARRGEEAPRRSRAALLAELLLARSAPGEERLDRARAAGVAIDGWHVAARVESRGRSAVTQADPVSEHALDETLHRLALQAARAAGGAWQATTVESALVLVCSDRAHGPALRRERVDAALRHVLGRIETAFPPLQLACGVGGAHEGLAGLRASAAEARAALASRRTSGRGPIQRFDELGAHRLVAEVLTSEQARTAIADLLAPLDRLGGRRAETAVQTLAAYLDEQGSVVRTAAALGVHRNAVTQRMGRIATALDVDLGDPETRLALQIACRARRLGSPT